MPPASGASCAALLSECSHALGMQLSLALVRLLSALFLLAALRHRLDADGCPGEYRYAEAYEQDVHDDCGDGLHLKSLPSSSRSRRL